MRTPAPFDPRRGRWIPFVFVGLMLIVVAVNGVLVFAALSTFTGVTSAHAYEEGRAYNHILEEAARQEALGWQASVQWSGGRLSVTVTDREGLPVPGHMEGTLQRPLEGTTRPLALAAAAPGRWGAAAADLAAGQWEARLVLRGPRAEKLDIRQRIFVP